MLDGDRLANESVLRTRSRSANRTRTGSIPVSETRWSSIAYRAIRGQVSACYLGLFLSTADTATLAVGEPPRVGQRGIEPLRIGLQPIALPTMLPPRTRKVPALQGFSSQVPLARITELALIMAFGESLPSVGPEGIEPSTSVVSAQRSTPKLSYSPIGTEVPLGLRRDDDESNLTVSLQCSLTELGQVSRRVDERRAVLLKDRGTVLLRHESELGVFIVICHVARLRVELRGATDLQSALGSGLPRHVSTLPLSGAYRKRVDGRRRPAVRDMRFELTQHKATGLQPAPTLQRWRSHMCSRACTAPVREHSRTATVPRTGFEPVFSLGENQES